MLKFAYFYVIFEIKLQYMKYIQIFVFILFQLTNLALFAQTTLNPKAGMQNLTYLNITKVEITALYTIVDMHYMAPYNDSSWACANKEFYIKGIYQTVRKKLIKAQGIPICDKKAWFTKKGQFIKFQLFFPKLEAGIEEIDVVEGYGPNQFNFYNVLINNPLKTENQQATLPKPQTNSTLPKQNTIKKTTNSTDKTTNNTTKTTTTQETTPTKIDSTAQKVLEKPKLVFGTKKVGLKDSVNIRINFDKASDVIKPESLPEMDKLLVFMNQNPSVVIELTGHTEADEASYTPKQRASNLQLSVDRISSVKSYLLTKGVATSRIQTRAYGGARPISQDPAINRRVVMRILKY
jgi:outer membrane protein OmpA-like peptidoglycan-associated protein